MSLTPESLTKRLQDYITKRNQHQQVVHQLNGAIQLLQNQIMELQKEKEAESEEELKQS